MLRKLRAKCEDVLGKEETTKLIEERVNQVLKETKPKSAAKRKNK